MVILDSVSEPVVIPNSRQFGLRVQVLIAVNIRIYKIVLDDSNSDILDTVNWNLEHVNYDLHKSKTVNNRIDFHLN